MVGGALGPQNRPSAPAAFSIRKMPSVWETKGGRDKDGSDRMTVRCHDYLSTIPWPNGTEGLVLYRQNLNPALFLGTSLELEAQLWDKYRLKSITVHYQPRCGTDDNGSFMFGFDPDAKDESGYTVGSTVNVRSFMAHQVTDETNVWAPRSLCYVNKDPQWLYVRNVNQDSYWTSPGMFVVLKGGTGTTSTSTGVLYFEATYEFMSRNVAAAVQQSAAYTVQSSTASASNPFGSASAGYRTGWDATAFFELPTFPATNQLKFSDMQPGREYVVMIHFTNGVTATGAGTITVATGTSVGTLLYIGTTLVDTFILQTFLPDESGVAVFTVTSGTFVTPPTTSQIFLTSLPPTGTGVNIL